jgi:hypothetical protein
MFTLHSSNICRQEVIDRAKIFFSESEDLFVTTRCQGYMCSATMKTKDMEAKLEALFKDVTNEYHGDNLMFEITNNTGITMICSTPVTS